jgi:hypothetical protein
MDILRSQNYEAIKEDICDDLKDKVVKLESWKDINNEDILNASIIVTLPATIANNTLPFNVDLIIIDEAHNRYIAKNRKEKDTCENQIERIITNNNIQKQLLVTGTPSIFNLKNQEAEREGLPIPYKQKVYTMLDVYNESIEVGGKWFTNLRYYTISANICKHEVLEDLFNSEGDVKESFHLTKKQNEKLLNSALARMVQAQINAIQVDNPDITNRKLCLSSAREDFKKLFNNLTGKKLGKTLWACHDQSTIYKTEYLCELIKKYEKSVMTFEDNSKLSKLSALRKDLLWNLWKYNE